MVGRDFLHFASRHHIMELVFAAAFKACKGIAVGLYVLLFKRLQAYWGRIDKTAFDSRLTDDEVQPRISAESERILTFATSQLTSHQPRDNYRELLAHDLIY